MAVLPCDPRSLEREVRQLLADKVSDSSVGLWLLAPELLRLGAWDLLCGWTGQSAERVEPRLALQLVHEAALCVTGVRAGRCLNQRGFELANGLPFLATDLAVHELLAARTIADSQLLQVALGKIRRASGHYQARLLALDPHRMLSSSKRHMRRRCVKPAERPRKMAQTFFVLDADTHEPICFTTGTASRTATAGAEESLGLAAAILDPQPGQTLVVADTEHFTVELLDHIKSHTRFDLLVPMPARRARLAALRRLPSETFAPRWAGYATAKLPYTADHSQSGQFYQYAQRTGECPEEYHFKAFVATTDGDEVLALTDDFPKRWHVEEFFNANQALGWDRAGTCNLNIRYGQMTMALLAEAAISQFRRRIGLPEKDWDAKHLARAYFQGLEGDIRVDGAGETVVVTYYNARDAAQLRRHYEDLPAKLKAEHVETRLPWLYGFKLDFRFR
ncbi:MAG TPA: transposase [Candidatus Methylomirabilis sp.]|nr:transposase [Candidatus Methylomirabilis sp.]